MLRIDKTSLNSRINYIIDEGKIVRASIQILNKKAGEKVGIWIYYTINRMVTWPLRVIPNLV